MTEIYRLVVVGGGVGGGGGGERDHEIYQQF